MRSVRGVNNLPCWRRERGSEQTRYMLLRVGLFMTSLIEPETELAAIREDHRGILVL